MWFMSFADLSGFHVKPSYAQALPGAICLLFEGQESKGPWAWLTALWGWVTMGPLLAWPTSSFQEFNLVLAEPYLKPLPIDSHPCPSLNWVVFLVFKKIKCNFLRSIRTIVIVCCCSYLILRMWLCHTELVPPLSQCCVANRTGI